MKKFLHMAKQRRAYIGEHLWDTEYGSLVALLGKQSDQKKLFKALPRLRPEYKDFVLAKYYERQNLRAKINFMEWFRNDCDAKLKEQ